MSGSTLRRTVLCLVVVAFLLPLASAWAAPAGERAARLQLPEWSRALLAPLSGLLDLFRQATEASSMPPGQKPGNGDGVSREGNGFDPHGKP